MRIFLFDMDGVLITPGGYRAAFIATMNHFGEQLGLGEIAPTIEEIELFEAMSITNEWDMIGLSMAEIVLGLAEHLPEPLATFEDLITYHRGQPAAALRPDYPRLARHIGAIWRRGNEKPSEAGLRWHLENGTAHATDILSQLLADNFDIATTPTTRVFQHFTLGSDAYQQTYQTPAEFATPSLLTEYDRAAISQDMRDSVLAQINAGKLNAAVYTARPSLPPSGHAALGYAPEAEPGLKVAGLETLPLIGTGHANWLAALLGKPEGIFIKPSPVQAIAAVGAALTHDEEGSLRAAPFLAEGNVPPFWEPYLGKALEVHVFEDSTGGIQAVAGAVERLEKVGIRARIVAHGIATSADKVRSLEQVADRVFPDINEALTSVGL